MSELGKVAMVVGLLLANSAIPPLAAPARAREWIRLFPRSVWAGRLLAAVAFLWVGYVLKAGMWGRFDGLKPLLVLVVPAAYFMTVTLMDELLAPRALGGILLLAAHPVLEAAFVHESDARLVMTTLAYLWAVAGMVLVVSPFRFRQVAAVLAASDGRCRLLGAIRLVLAAAILFLGLRVYC